MIQQRILIRSGKNHCKANDKYGSKDNFLKTLSAGFLFALAFKINAITLPQEAR